MPLCNLPEDILAILLSRCVGNRTSTACELKRILPLLAVCRLWRRLAAPPVYSHAFVQYGDHPTRVASLPIRIGAAEEPTDVVVKTNLDLITMAGYASAVKRVQIDVHCLANPFPGWREVIQRMRAVATEWRAVQLTATMHPDFYSFNGSSNADTTYYMDDIAEVADALAALMPDVCRLECAGVNRCSIARSLYGRLASHYAGQLRRLDSQHLIAVLQGCLFTKLRRFHIDYGRGIDYQLPHMASGELVDMSLVNGPANHSWASFSTNSGSRTIEFAKLKRLYVEYGSTYRGDGAAVRHCDGHPWGLYFTGLERLFIRSSQDVCPLLAYAVLPAHMEVVSIHMKSTSYKDHADLVLPATKRLIIGISMDSCGDPSGLPAINRILENARGSESLELNIEDDMLAMVPESITCTALTHLQVWPTTSVDAMFATIRRLPYLAKLALYDLSMSEIQADISIPGADVDAAVEPLSPSLRSLTINYDKGRQSSDTAVAVKKHLLLRIPTLTELSSAQTPKSPLVRFVEEYAPRHPHLSGVELILS
ncbi:hypothetical protein H4R21_000530 [Coemansia helicoidea]|uniref:Uncharacterized protein n=1 Tax=Coemansia helicoidea TaxID=1286919 RepID=A0ACC1LFB2_9FUNG|nr:hypothetical protein H4R21_000530 [Coemansia helicoidea]